MLYLDHTCNSYFIAFHSAILEILSNSRTNEESWGFHRFHIRNFLKYQNKGHFGFNYFSLRKYFSLKYMRGDNMTSLIYLKYWRKNIKIKYLFHLDFYCNFVCIRKIARFQNCILGPRKCSTHSKYFI